ncbi:MAG: hypothetical protein J3K34DRAFT_379266, partial [Monoraphidium minutum]
MDAFLSKVLGTLGAKDVPQKEYWVDDTKCKACYECDQPFGLLVRRHHCRICGRIFCATCTSNSVPPPRDSPDQQWQRVCNYCHRIRQRSSSYAPHPDGGAERGLEQHLATDEAADTSDAPEPGSPDHAGGAAGG